jgi:hypothetical protein
MCALAAGVASAINMLNRSESLLAVGWLRPVIGYFSHYEHGSTCSSGVLCPIVRSISRRRNWAMMLDRSEPFGWLWILQQIIRIANQSLRYST